MKKSFKKLVLALAIMGVTVSTAHANLVTNGGFETGDFTGWTQGGDMSFTGVVGGTMEGSYFGIFGPTVSNGTLSQTIATTTGDLYNFSFLYGIDPGTPNYFSVSIDGGVTNLYAVTNAGATSVTPLSFDFTATSGATNLVFTFFDAPAYVRLDNVNVSAVPEPAPLALLGIGALGFILNRRKQV
jgi:hypothetical protein